MNSFGYDEQVKVARGLEETGEAALRVASVVEEFLGNVAAQGRGNAEIVNNIAVSLDRLADAQSRMADTAAATAKFQQDMGLQQMALIERQMAMFERQMAVLDRQIVQIEAEEAASTARQAEIEERFRQSRKDKDENKLS